MNQRLTVAVLGVLLVGASWAKQESPVTVAEADQSFRKVFTHLQQSLQLTPSKFVPSTAKSPLTRDVAIQRFHALYEYIKPKIQTRVKPQPVDSSKFSAGLSRDRQRQLATLVSYKLLPSDSPLVVGTKNQYAPREFGKILGAFLTQAMDITHVMDPKFSPELMPD